jgi:DNA ligase (NAD+)
LDKFIYSLGIRHVGTVTAELLAEYFKNFELFYTNIESDKLGDLEKIDGIGPIIFKSIKDYFSEEDNVKFIGELSRYVKIIDYKNNRSNDNISSILSGKRIIFTGTLESMSREEAQKKAKELGAKVVSDISVKTDLIVVGAQAGSKLDKAQKLNIKILSEKEWLELIANDPKYGPKQAFDCFMQVAEYHVPKLARTEHTGSEEKPIRYVVSWKK